MKKLFLLIHIIVYQVCFSQTKTSTILKDSVIGKIPQTVNSKAGSCGSPDGSMNSTAINPPSYAWLQANGYCNPGMYGQFPTVCWTFTPTSSSVTINSGFSYNCNNVTFANFILYDNTCTQVGIGLNFAGLIPGQQYTWCMDGFAWGGPGCTGFTGFCPYFFNNTVLPIELIEFAGHNLRKEDNYLYWAAATETNNDYFTLERSRGGEFWELIETLQGSGTTNTPSFYEFHDNSYIDGVNYYRLSQTDFDGKTELFNIVAINTKIVPTYTKLMYITDVTGRYIDFNPTTEDLPKGVTGFFFYVYKDGSILPIYKLGTE